MSIVLFALLGAALHAPTAYWICFGLFCVAWVFNWVVTIRHLLRTSNLMERVETLTDTLLKLCDKLAGKKKD